MAAAALGLGGCATPGPLHLYTVSAASPATVSDSGGDATPTFLAAGETLLGLAYDPFTDYFFLRLAPGDRFRVVDRPARAVKREFSVPALAAAPLRAGDLAIRPRDGHLFAAHPTAPAVVELNRFGQLVRTLPLATHSVPPSALAFDTVRDHLLALGGDSGPRPRVTTHDPAGAVLSTVVLDRAVTPTSLAYDSVKRELYAPLADEPALGVFDDQGRLLRALPFGTPATAPFLDVGPRSFLRLY